MKTKVKFSGGYFNNSMYGVLDSENLPEDILMHHYVNPIAEQQGITILGITKKGPDDITVVERYVRHDTLGPEDEFDIPTEIYRFAGTVDPGKVRRRELPDGDYVLDYVGDDHAD